MSDLYGIPKDEQCVGSGGAPSSRGIRTEGDGSKTGRCPVCAGRFRLHEKAFLPKHRAVPEGEREDPNAY